jgi:pimeloyl-ACP methyl ester carboxylesterase
MTTTALTATTFHTAQVQGLNVFYRQAGDPSNPKVLLLGGFPSSSHQFRNLIPALAQRFHVVSPDYPGFGNTDMPDPATWSYTFDHLADIVDGLLTQIGFTGPMGIYMQDYGGPIGNRIISAHPDWLQWQVIQNANTYEEGFTEAWDGIRHALWVDRSAATEAPLKAFLQPETVKAIYTTGHPDLSKISPDNWNTDCSSCRVSTPNGCNSTCSTTTGPTPRSTRCGRSRYVSVNHSHLSSGVKATSSSPPPVARPTSAIYPTPN